MNFKKIGWGIVLFISMAVLTISVAFIVVYLSSDNDDSQYINNHATTEVFSDKNTVDNHNIDWQRLQEDNADVYAWIYIPNTNVDHAIVQPTGSETNDFYLHKDLKKNYSFAGSIYTEKYNAKDFSDPVTLIYGHNMLNGSMFASLHNFEDKTFFKKNQYIYIYMPYHRLTYKIYAAYVYDDRHILNSFDFSDKKVLKKYFQFTQDPESVNKNTRKADLNINSKIITLSTCTNGAENTRYLVQGVLIKDEQTN